MKKKTGIRVVIADDHAIVRAGLKQILSDTRDMVLAGSAENGFEAIKFAQEGGFDVLLLDIAMPRMSGIEALKKIRTIDRKLAVLVLSMHRANQYALRALRAGAAGYLNKQSAPGELVSAIRTVAAGHKYVSPEIAQQLIDNVGNEEAAEASLHDSLSDREFQTLTLLASGKSVSDIAAELSLSVKTISMFRSRLLKKMKMRHNAELTHYAIRNKLVDE